MANLLHLPEKLQQNLVLFADAKVEAVDELYEELAKSGPAFFGDAYLESFVSRLKHWPRPDLDASLTALVGLCLSRAAHGTSPEEFADEVLIALRRTALRSPDKTRKTVTRDREELLRTRILRFLTLDSFVISARAYDVLTAHQRVMYTCRIFSDIRSIFGDDLAKGPAAAVIVHKLKIEFRESGERKELYFALDTKDLKTLAETVKRAEAKEAALRKTLAAMGTVLLEPK
ncbi:hypothetical protein BWI17_01845 [Betaproteobacteria bacterium GR16-43]|nr:hypothetical protein BWI17_01845 [Betaproteobacteria bacterium GR16-43]